MAAHVGVPLGDYVPTADPELDVLLLASFPDCPTALQAVKDCRQALRG
jgi:hypothetical protein